MLLSRLCISKEGRDESIGIRRQAPVDAAVVENGRREFLGADLYLRSSHSECCRTRALPIARLESVSFGVGHGLPGWSGNDGWLPPGSCASRSEAESGHRTASDLVCGVQWVRVAEHLDCKPSQSSRKLGHYRRRLQPPSWWILVGASAMALPVGAVEYAKVGS